MCTIQLFATGGIVYQMTILFLMNMIVPQFVLLFADVSVYMTWIEKWRLNYFMTNKKGKIYSQKMANEVVQKSEFAIYDPYSYIFSTLAAGLFFSTIFPLGIPMIVFSFFFSFWVYKYILIKRCHNLIQLDSSISTELIDEMELCVLIYGVSNTLFFNKIVWTCRPAEHNKYHERVPLHLSFLERVPHYTCRLSHLPV